MSEQAAVAVVNGMAESGDNYALLLTGMFTTAICNRNQAERYGDDTSVTYWATRSDDIYTEIVGYGRFSRGYVTA